MYNTFSYGRIDSSTFGLTCDRETHSILPEQRKYVQEIPGLDGAVDFGIGGYSTRVMTVDVYFTGDYADLRANREKIIAWLANSNGSPKELIFGNDPDRYYMAKIYAALDFKNTPEHNIGSIQFECNPPWQYQNGILLTPDEIAWNTQDNLEGVQWMKEFTAPDSLRLTNAGTLSVKPKIKLFNNIPSGLILTYGDNKWQYNAALQHDGILIDCAAETVTRMSDGVNLFLNVDQINDAFFQIKPGQAEITVTASDLGGWPDSLILTVEFTPQEMS